MSLAPLARTFADHLAALPEPRRRQLAMEATRRARTLGLVVLRDHGDVDIPLTLTPELVAPASLEERGRDARAVLDGVLATARQLLGEGLQTPRANELFAHFGPLERRCLERWRDAESVTIARVDWFLDASGRHHALELNATIPAMEAYSDAAARAWIETLGAHAGLSEAETARLVAANGSNAEELRASIVARSGRGADERPSIAILHRARDSQVRELEALARHFSARGHAVRLATPELVTVTPGREVLVAGERYDVLYRHIFARRMPEGSALAEVALGGTRPALQNPVNGHLEVKGLMGELSRLLSEAPGSLGLSAPTLGRLARVVPWTRLFGAGACVGPDGRPAPDLVGLVGASPERFVLKRSWDYGGKSVYIGRDVVRAEGAAGWEAKVREALAAGPGAFVAQELVDAPRRPHCVVGPEGATTFEDVFVDASTYSATGEDAVPGGSVARYARTGIVNIVGGGGVCPLVRSDVAERIATALEGRG